jgi:hypothetical protein
LAGYLEMLEVHLPAVARPVVGVLAEVVMVVVVRLVCLQRR